MGQTQKPLHIVLDKSLYDISEEQWVSMRAQGHTIEVITGVIPDLYIAQHAMRLTANMLQQLPSAFALAMAGARALRYAPVAKDPTAWKGGKKNAKAKGTHKRTHATKQTKATDTGEPPATTEDQGTGGTAVSTVSETTNDEGATQTE